MQRLISLRSLKVWHARALGSLEGFYGGGVQVLYEENAPVFTQAHGASDAAIGEPAEIILICESRYRYPDVFPSPEDWSSFRYSFRSEQTPNSDLGVMQTHSGMSNFIFFDGHAKAMKPISTLKAHLPLSMWHYSLNAPWDYKDQATFETMRKKWTDQLLAHKEYQ